MGKRPRSKGAGVFDGDDEIPFPNRFVRTMKYFSGLSARLGPHRNISLSASVPVYQEGKRNGTMTDRGGAYRFRLNSLRFTLASRV